MSFVRVNVGQHWTDDGSFDQISCILDNIFLPKLIINRRLVSRSVIFGKFAVNLLQHIDNCVGPCAHTHWLKRQVCSKFLSFGHIVWYFGQNMSQMVIFLKKKRQIWNRRKISHLVTMKICGLKIGPKTGFWGLIVSCTIFLSAYCLYLDHGENRNAGRRDA